MKNELKINNNGKEVSIEAKVAIVVSKKNESWVASVPSLKVFGLSCKSEEDAINEAKENLNIFFQVHLEDDTLDDALNTFGWEMEFNFKNITKGNYYPKFSFEQPKKGLNSRKGIHSKRETITIPLNSMAYAAATY